jgi:hypothetical protein
MVDDSDIYILEYLFCCQFTQDHKIINLLEDLALKRQKCTLNNKIKSYGDDYYKLYQDVLKHFKIKNTKNSEIALTNIKNWSSIRKKAIKDLLLKNFIIEVKFKYEFDDSTINNLKRDIMVGLNFKNINDKNIVIEENKIVMIKGLHLSKNSYNWEYEIFSFK